jgi:hypothetical protein
MIIEGKPSKRFRVFRLDDKGEPYECVCEFDTLGEVRWPTRQDRRHKISVDQKFMTRTEFNSWAKSQNR